jgi:hypothetical protein
MPARLQILGLSKVGQPPKSIKKEIRLILQSMKSVRPALLKALKDNQSATLFEYEEDKMYAKRESELIQRYLQLMKAKSLYDS